ncbi:MAG: hypothetical protein ABEJ82_00205 [Haloplanus sp.]
MQRRAAAIYVAFFIVLGAASYSLIATASAPGISFQNPEHRVTQGDQFSVDGRQYTVSKLTAEMQGGGHGSSARLSRSGQLTWTNESARYTETWDNNSTVTYDGTQYQVLVASGEDPSTFELQETINRTAILQNDSSVANQTVTVDGTEYVVRGQGDQRELVPASEYFPTPASTQYEEGQQIQYNGNDTTVDTVASDGVTLAWNAPKDNTVEVSDQSNVTLDGGTYLAYFEDNSTLVLTKNFQSYDRQSQRIEEYHKHVTGLWGVSIVSFAVAALLVGMAYLPSRY